MGLSFLIRRIGTLPASCAQQSTSARSRRARGRSRMDARLDFNHSWSVSASAGLL